ncbi:MAG: hypothetical protein K6C94_07770 [Candidatus Gastranaerophilales bacterium]|nr:hypothetical protein [Candidatus Gastranaerophilales bacterium]
MREIEIGTILAEVSPTTNLKHFIVYDKEGRTVWATDGYKDAEIVKKTNNYFVIFADNNYLAFYCKEINFETGMYIFYEGNYKSFLEYQELIDFEKAEKQEDFLLTMKMM